MSFRLLSNWTQLCITKGNIKLPLGADGSGVPRCVGKQALRYDRRCNDGPDERF